MPYAIDLLQLLADPHRSAASAPASPDAFDRLAGGRPDRTDRALAAGPIGLFRPARQVRRQPRPFAPLAG
ncbi:hypothetical protein [Frigidibacter oleivorans]|uniref:hypothetical protein n=1 Tax=Frigidibacter oleivorans TaxID=2487129 RepID=UPI000F8DEFDE|nr:hypothetical protein [Frigidibacter oleivorans]